MTDSPRRLDALLQLMARLRDPERGCPWDQAQTFATIAPYTIEEAYEVLDAIERGDPARLRDELGDLLFQVVFHARMAEERGWFDFDAVAEGIHDKLVRRHPHVFGDEHAHDAASLSRRWEEIKAAERAERGGEGGEGGGSLLDDVPHALPALTRAMKLGRRAARVGFDWQRTEDVREKITEELRELDAELAKPGVDGEQGAPRPELVDELGDVLFAVVNLSRHLRIDPEAALRGANMKFERRFRRMEELARSRGLQLAQMNARELDELWREAKDGPA